MSYCGKPFSVVFVFTTVKTQQVAKLFVSFFKTDKILSLTLADCND